MFNRNTINKTYNEIYDIENLVSVLKGSGLDVTVVAMAKSILAEDNRRLLNTCNIILNGFNKCRLDYLILETMGSIDNKYIERNLYFMDREANDIRNSCRDKLTNYNEGELNDVLMLFFTRRLIEILLQNIGYMDRQLNNLFTMRVNNLLRSNNYNIKYEERSNILISLGCDSIIPKILNRIQNSLTSVIDVDLNLRVNFNGIIEPLYFIKEYFLNNVNMNVINTKIRNMGVRDIFNYSSYGFICKNIGVNPEGIFRVKGNTNIQIYSMILNNLNDIQDVATIPIKIDVLSYLKFLSNVYWIKTLPRSLYCFKNRHSVNTVGDFLPKSIILGADNNKVFFVTKPSMQGSRVQLIKSYSVVRPEDRYLK